MRLRSLTSTIEPTIRTARPRSSWTTKARSSMVPQLPSPRLIRYSADQVVSPLSITAFSPDITRSRSSGWISSLQPSMRGATSPGPRPNTAPRLPLRHTSPVTTLKSQIVSLTVRAMNSKRSRAARASSSARTFPVTSTDTDRKAG